MRVKPDEKINDVLSMGLQQAASFDIADPQKFISLILDNSYKDPITATVREICQNASEVDPNFTVHLPTDLEPWFAVIDNGTGLSRDDLVKYASGIGASTKDKDNTKVGGFGIGMKVPFTMSDQYTIIDRYEGVQYTFSAYKDEFGDAQFVELSTPVHTDEPNGLEIRVPVERFDFIKMKDKFVHALKYFNPKPETNVEVDWLEPEYITQGKDWGLRRKQSHEYSTESRIIMGNLWYPVDDEKIRDGYSDPVGKLLRSNLDITLPIGSIDLPISREDILYSPRTIKVIRQKCEDIIEEFKVSAQQQIDKLTTPWEAMDFANGNTLVQLSGVKLKWKGEEVNSLINVDFDDSMNYYIASSYKFSRKTLSLSDAYQTKHNKGKMRLSYTSNSTVWFIVHHKAVRKPSRLLEYVKNNYSNVDCRLIEYPDGKRQVALDWIKTNVGLGEDSIIDFDQDVPDIKVQHTYVPPSQRKKLAKVKVLNMEASRYGDTSKDYWNDYPGDLDLDANTGIYVNLKSNEPDFENEFRWVSNGTIQETIKVWKRYNLIPHDTVVYGCPANVKNKLKDHPNYISYEDASKLVDEMVSEHKSSLVKYILAQQVDHVMTELKIPVDKGIKTGYYKVCLDKRDVFYGIKDINKKDIINYAVNIVGVKDRRNRLSIYGDTLTKKITKEYPMLSDRSTPSYDNVGKYIKMVHYVNEKGIEL